MAGEIASVIVSLSVGSQKKGPYGPFSFAAMFHDQAPAAPNYRSTTRGAISAAR